MTHAVEEFFPESGILDGHGVIDTQSRASTSSERPYPLRRVDTGISSIVGSNNGEKPGGFILVIDGGALSDVGVSIIPVLLSTDRHNVGFTR